MAITELKISFHLQKVLWIGPPDLGVLKKDTLGASQLAASLDKSSKNRCEIFVAGSTPCKAVERIPRLSSPITLFKNTTVVWEFLKGRSLPGIVALDKVNMRSC